MKKIIAIAASLCALLLISSCNKPADANAAAVESVKKAAVGSWSGELNPLGMGEPETVTVTFTETKVSTTTNFTANITAWKGGVDKVWAELDDESKSSLIVSIQGDKMTLGGNSTAIIMNFPKSLTKVK